MRLSKLLLIGLLLLILCAFLTGCQPDDVVPDDTAPDSENNVIKIGYVAPFTGPAAEFGTNGLRGVEIAVDEVNAAGIVIDGETYTIEIVRYDSQCEPTQSVASVNKMILEDGVVAFLGDHCSSCCMAIAPLADENMVPGITIECAAEAVTKPGHPYFFRMRPDMALMSPLAAGPIFEAIQPSTIAYVAVNDDYGRSWVETHQEGLDEFGVESLSEDYFERGTTDFTILLTNIRQLQPDMVGYVGTSTEGALLLEQAYEMGLIPDIAFYGAEEMASYEMLDLAGAEVLEGTYAIALYGEAPADLEQAVMERYNAPLHYAIIFAYDGVHVLADAISRAQSLDSTAIRDALKAGTYETLAGFTEFQDFDGYQNQGFYVPYLIRWEDGDMVLVQ
ncbi:MAG: ABC transporter substrate-binding protein [Bacillota bacterium]|nr:ABC transporter substrate-binding protein [Bacillota bacterium]